MDLRRAIPDDVPKIHSLELASFSDPWSERDILGTVCSEGGICFVAIDGGEVIGYVFGRLIAPEGEIYRIAVRADKRKRGIGYRLLSYMMKTERGQGLETVFLEVRESNLAARNLYSAFGFQEIGVRKNYYQSPTENAVIMLYGEKKY